ncbi:YciI family protein [Gracilimonas sp. Q87]|uniref:YciI family protein n=1 Tax=Gracilimonas sp. Q87 TaxID=3384766 RepID=UPI0039842554
MQKYFILFLKNGENRSQCKEKSMQLQQEHFAYLGGLHEKSITLNGPNGGDSDIRGFSVYNSATMEQVKKYAENDPMVKTVRLRVEVHPWWLAIGSGVK